MRGTCAPVLVAEDAGCLLQPNGQMQVPRVVASGAAKLVLVEPANHLDLALVPVLFPAPEHLRPIDMVREPHIEVDPLYMRFPTMHGTLFTNAS